MDIEFDDEGGYADLTTGEDARTTLKAFRTADDQLRISLDSRARHGEMGLGVGLTVDQARRFGEYLVAQATLMAEDEDEDEEE